MATESDTKLNDIIKIKIKDVNENIDKETGDKTFSITIPEEKIGKKITLIRESEIIRIVKALDLKNLYPRKDKNGKDCDFPFVRDLIAMNVSSDEYKKNKAGLITVIYENMRGMKIVQNAVQFKRLLASTSNVRNKKIMYIREILYENVNEILLCGMPKDMEHKQFSKYSAYYALASTDSIPVRMPNIVVIDDYKNDITGTCDLVKEEITKGNVILHKKTGKSLIDKNTHQMKKENDIIKYSVKNGEKYTVQGNKPFDGAGVVDVSLATIWAEKLGLDYIPSAFQFRAIPGIKGNLYVFDFNKFAKEFHENVSKDEFGKVIIKDAWGIGRYLYKEDGTLGIDVILTKSQYKFFDYINFDDWKIEFETERHGYKRTFNISNVSDKFEDIKDKVLLSYQPLQSLNLSLDEIKNLCDYTIKKIECISTDVNEFLKYRGLLDYKENNKGESKPKTDVPSYYRALQKNPEQLFADKYIQGKVQADIKKFKENTCKRAVLISGNYQTLMPDIFALAQWAFGIVPTGLLKGDEIYSKFWLNKKVSEIDIIRFPHIANEHSIGKVVSVKEEFRDYYEYATEGIITSIDTFIPLKANSADFDGDHILTNCSSILISALENQHSNTIIYIPAEKDADTSLTTYKIDDMEKTIDTDIKGMSNSIGRVVNQITKLWSLEQTTETSDYIKIMSVIGSLTIDFVKTGEKAAIPKIITDFLNEIKKPDFMRIIYQKQARNEKDINTNKRINKQAEISLFGSTDCTMNRLYKHMKEELHKIGFKKDKKDFDYKILMNNPSPNISGNKTYPLIVKTLLELKKEYGIITKENSMENDNGEYNDDAKQDHEYKYRIFNDYARRTLLALCTPKNQMTIGKLLDYLVYAHYCDETIAKHNDKNIIWNCFGVEFNKILKQGMTAEFKEVNHVTNDKILGNIKDKHIHKFKSEANSGNIIIFEPKENPKEVEIFESEINYIKDTLKTPEERRMAFILIAMNKFCIAYDKEFDIYNGEKNRIVKSHIWQLSKVHNRDYESTMSQLIQYGVIKFEQKKDTPTSTCKIIPLLQQEGKPIKLTNLNQCQKYFKKLV